MLREHGAGLRTADRCRKHGIWEAPFYAWKTKYGGLGVSEAKQLLTEANLDNTVPKDLTVRKF